MSDTAMDIYELMKYLPHRYPFLLIDRVLEIHAGKSLSAIKNVSNNEPFFTGHFPQRMIMPGVLILEALAQAGAILAYKSSEQLADNKSLYLLAGIDNARFKRVVIPGDQLKLDVVFDKIRRNFLKIQATASVDGETVCTADILSIKQEHKHD